MQLLDSLNKVSTLIPLALVFLGGLYTLITATGGLLKGVVAMLKWQDGRLDHAANACLGFGLDVMKVINALKALAAKFGIGEAAKVLVGVALALTLLVPRGAHAQNTTPSCLGLTNIHCGPALSLLEVAPLGAAGGLASDVPLALGAGYQVEIHFRLWDLASAVFGNLLYLWKGQPVGEVSAAVFACLGDSFGKLHGSCLGLGAPAAGPEGGFLGGWTWKKDLRLVFNAGPDLIGYLAEL